MSTALPAGLRLRGTPAAAPTLPLPVKVDREAPPADPEPDTVPAPNPAPSKGVSAKSAALRTAHALAELMESVQGKDAELGAKVNALAKRLDALADQPTRTIRFEVSGKLGEPVKGAHPILPDLVQTVAAGLTNLWLSGPAGSGKSTLAQHLAEALGQPFGAQSFAADSTSASLIGGPNAQGIYQESAFIAAYESGSVYLLDELDAAPAEIVVQVNSALANGHLHLPRHHDAARRTIKRHADTVIVAAANTWGTGPSAQYVGRSAIDAATLDRFALAMFYVGYDQAREFAYLGAKAPPIARANTPRNTSTDRQALADQILQIRAKVEDYKIRRIISTRSFIAAAKLSAIGYTNGQIIDRMLAAWTGEERAKVGA